LGGFCSSMFFSKALTLRTAVSLSCHSRQNHSNLFFAWHYQTYLRDRGNILNRKCNNKPNRVISRNDNLLETFRLKHFLQDGLKFRKKKISMVWQKESESYLILLATEACLLPAHEVQPVL
jgi:hypothetical protein